MKGRPTRARRAPRRRLAVDPMAAFRTRMRRDRRNLIALSSTLRGSMRWTRAAVRLAAIERLAHGLAGAGGVFGYGALGEDAARLERLLERWRLRPPVQLSSRRIAAFARRLAVLLAHLHAASRT